MKNNSSKRALSLITYEPDNALKQGYFLIFKNIIIELKKNRWLIYQLFMRDFLSMYKQSVIGFLWAILVPLVSVGTFIVLNKSGVFNVGKMEIPYPIFAISGIALWQLFTTGIISGANSLVKAGSMIAKINFSKKSLVIASTGQAFIAFIVQFFLLSILLIVYGISPDIKIILLPILIIPIIFLTLGLSFILSVLNGIIRDIGNALSIFLTFFMFLTPILYVKPDSGFLANISEANPMYYLVTFPRDIILFGHSDNFLGYLYSSLFAVIIFVICILVFHLTETRVAERI